MLVKYLSGMKFPEEYLIRFFFKQKLDKAKGRVLELGCGNGNNLLLFYQYGWKVCGVDIDAKAISQAKMNFRRLQNREGLKNNFGFLKQDMLDFCRAYKGLPFSVLLFPGSIYYLDYPRIKELFLKIAKNRIIKGGSLLFIRFRTPGDYRYAKGRRLGKRTFKIAIAETGEKNSIMTFLTKKDLSGLLAKPFCFSYAYFLESSFQNLQDGRLINNADIIFWGRIKKANK